MERGQQFSCARSRILRTIGRLALIVGLTAAACEAARCQDQSAATPKDAIFARKILMDSIDEQMTAIEGVVNSGQAFDLDEAADHVDTISVMLMAFPHLFPPSTNQWQPNAQRDPAHDTYAAPEVWTNFSDFYQRAAAASKLAYTASRAKQVGDFEKAMASLRIDCNACHADYLKTDQ
jgi:cytochrome c556